MKLCYLGDAGSVHLLRFLEFFAAAGNEVSVLSFARPAQPIEGVRFHLIPGVPGTLRRVRGWQLASAGVVRGLIAGLQPDVVHAHYLTSYGLLAALSGHPHLVMSAWGSDVLGPSGRGPFRPLLRYVVSRAAAVSADSEDMADELRTITNSGGRAKIHVVPFGVPRASILELPKEGRGDLIIGSFRQLEANYNVDVILRAFALVRAEDARIRLEIWNQGSMARSLAALASKLGIEDSVRFMGIARREEMQGILQRIPLHVTVPGLDATSVTLLEGMAAGGFPIASDLPANREWLGANGEGGLLVPVRKVDALAEAIRRAVTDVGLVRRAVVRNLALVRKRAVWEENMRAMDSIYRAAANA